MPMEQKHQWNAGYWFAVLLLFMLLQSYLQSTSSVEEVPYSEFVQALEAGRIDEVVVSDRRLRGQLKSPDAAGNTAIVATRLEADVAELLAGYDVRYARVIESTWLRDLLSWVLPALVFFGIWFFLFRRLADRQGMGGFMTIGKSRAKIYLEKNTGVSFGDVAGVDEAEAELVEVVDFLKHPEEYGRLGARIPKGVLLVGPPGTGKTLLAKAVAGEAGVPFFSISGSEFVEMFVGVGAARVRDLFAQAGEQAPAIIFIDELDALGRARGAGGMAGGHDESEQTLNQLLAEIDGFDSSVGLIILGATNRPDILDPALLRPGRFDRQVLVDRPDRRGRLDILRVHVRGITLAPDVDLEQVASTRRRSSPRGARPSPSPCPISPPPSSASSPASRRRTACSAPTSAAPSPTTRWGTPWWPWPCRARTWCTRCRSSRAASAPWATRCSGRQRIAT